MDMHTCTCSQCQLAVQRHLSNSKVTHGVRGHSQQRMSLADDVQCPAEQRAELGETLNRSRSLHGLSGPQWIRPQPTPCDVIQGRGGAQLDRQAKSSVQEQRGPRWDLQQRTTRHDRRGSHVDGQQTSNTIHGLGQPQWNRQHPTVNIMHGQGPQWERQQPTTSYTTPVGESRVSNSVPLRSSIEKMKTDSSEGRRQQTARLNGLCCPQNETLEVMDNGVPYGMIHSRDSLMQRHSSSFEANSHYKHRDSQNTSKSVQNALHRHPKYIDDGNVHQTAKPCLRVPPDTTTHQRLNETHGENRKENQNVHTHSNEHYHRSERRTSGDISVGPRGKQQTVQPGIMEERPKERMSSGHTEHSSMAKYFHEAFQRQRTFVVKTMEKSMAHLSVDIQKLLDTMMKQDREIRQLAASFADLAHRQSQAAEELVRRHDLYDRQLGEAGNFIRKHKDLVSELIMEQCNYKAETDDDLKKRNREYILEMCNINDDIESLITCIKKEFAASDERRRIYMESTRFRIHTSTTYVKNALQVWKTSIKKDFGRTNTNVTSQILEGRTEWKRDIETIKLHNKERMDALKQKIKKLEDETKRKIDNIATTMDELEKTVHTDISGNENFRKIVRSYTTTCKSLADQLSDEIKSIEADLKQRLKKNDVSMRKLQLDLDKMFKSKLDDKTVKDDLIDKQVKYLARQVKILSFHVGKKSK